MRQLLPEHPARPRKPALVGEWSQVEVVDLHLQARRDVVAHHAKPLPLLVREDTALGFLLSEPVLDPRLHALNVRDKVALRMEREANKRNHVREEPPGRGTAYLGLLQGFVRPPQFLRRPGPRRRLDGVGELLDVLE